MKELLGGEMVAAGRQDVVWNGQDDHGRRVASGTYFYRLVGAGFLETRRMSLIK